MRRIFTVTCLLAGAGACFLACSGGDSSGSGGSGAGSGQGMSMAPDSTDSGTPGSGSASGSSAGSGSASSGAGSSGSSHSGSGSGSSSGASTGSSSGASTGASSGASTGSSSGASTGASSGNPSGCTWGTNRTPATFTEYYFGQGNETEGACGYFGTAGTVGPNLYDHPDIVNNIANSGGAKNTYFAAMPSDSAGNWPYQNCGACVVVTGKNGAKVIATLIDECPTTGGINSPCTEGNHLDLSTAAFAATEVASGGKNTGGDEAGSWHFIACPVTGDIVTLFNNGYKGQIYIQNMVYPIASGTANGKALTQSQYAYWEASGINDMSGVTLKLTDVLGHTITGTVSGSDGGSLGAQFPSPGACPVE